MKDYLLNILKPLLRFCYYKNERRKVFREISIRKKQNKAIVEKYDNQISHLIIFLVEGANWFSGKDEISGGILSIASIYEETLKLKSIHHSETIMVTHPSAHLLLRHSQFPNKIPVFRFKQLKYFSKATNLLVHIPEYQFNFDLVKCLHMVFSNVPPQNIHLNILNQRISIMPLPQKIKEVKDLGFYVTQTTAHEQYSNKEIRDKFGIPLHKLSVYATPERYNYKTHKEKENLILVSPDAGQLKEDILNKIKQELVNFQIKIINGISYMNYLKLIERAKYMITFGEGLDFYFIETAFSGGIAFACYNRNFFTKEFKKLDGVFESYGQMLEQICNMIIKAEDDIKQYKRINQQQFDACHQIYNEKYYKENLINFYSKKYLFP